MSGTLFEKEVESALPTGWIQKYKIESSHGSVFAEYEHDTGCSVSITPKVPYRQPWSVPEYFIEYTEENRAYLAPSKRICHFHLAKEIAMEKMKQISIQHSEEE